MENLEINSDVIDAVATAVRKYRDVRRTTPHVELELRLGSRGKGGRFVAGCSREFVHAALARVLKSSAFVQSDWNECHDFFYLANGDAVRSRVSFNTDNLELTRVTVKKKRIYDVVLACGEVMIRVALNLETPYTQPLPFVVTTTHMRIQQRRSFTYGGSKSTDTDKCWAYDFSLTWAGKTKNDAEARQNSEDAIFEMEIELLSFQYLTRNSDEHVAASLLMKACDFIEDGRKNIQVQTMAAPTKSVR